MPTYSSVDDQSFRKMESYKRDSFGRKKRFNMGNIFGNPFALASISVGVVSHVALSPITCIHKAEIDVLTMNPTDGMDNSLCQLDRRCCSDQCLS